MSVSSPQVNNHKRGRHVLWFLAPIVLVGLFLSSNLLISKDDRLIVPKAKVKRGAVTIKITEIGELRAQEQVTISAINDKQIIWLVPEGKWVETGDTLVVFESEKYMISRGEAYSQVLVEKAGMTQAESDLEAQRTKEEAARKNYETLPELVKKGFIMESELEQARLTYLEMKSRTRSMQAGVDAARANVDRAARGLSQQDRKLRQSVMLAPRAGLVVYALVGDEQNQKKISLGMTPFEGMDLMYLPDISTMLVDVEISEVDLAKLRIGQPAEVRLDAYPDTVFKGEIASIADLAKRKISRITGKASGAKVFDLTIKVLDRDVRLKPGLTATVDIIVKQYPDALYIPLEAVFLDEQERTVVFVKRGGGVETRPITVVDSNDRVIIVKTGLQAGDEVLLDRPASS